MAYIYQTPHRMTMKVRLIGLGILLGSLAGCSVQVTAPDLYGEWGGEHVALQVSAQGGVLEYDCAHGSIEAPVMPDGQGRFEVGGMYVLEHGGPVREGELPDSHPALYSGWTNGARMVIEVTFLDSGETVGPYTMQLNGAPRLFKCL
jgi:hypothetical protein